MHRAAFITILAALAFAAPAHAQGAPDSSRQALRTWRGRVTYLAGSSVYVNAGRLEGLLSGDTLSIWRGPSRVAVVRVDAVASHRATCDTLTTASLLQTGDEVRFVGGGVSPEASEPPRPAASVERAPKGSSMQPDRLRGRIGAQYLSVADAGGSRFAQPMLDVRLEQRFEHGNLLLDVRGRRTVVTGNDGDAQSRTLSRVHRASIVLGPAKGLRSAIGRQSAPSLGVVSVFDGALVEHRGTRWSMGAFAGTQPEPVRMGLDGAIREFGAFVESSSPARGPDRWALTLGGVASYDHGEPDREFLYLQGSGRRGPLTSYFSQEIDFQRAWERALGEPAVSFSSSYASVLVQAHRSVHLSAGVDNRRRVRLWRDRETPETEFDDQYRQGTWLGSTWTPIRAVRMTADIRFLRGGDAADSRTVTGDLMGRGRWAPVLRARHSVFSSGSSESGLWSAGLGGSPWAGSQLSWSTGERRTRESLDGLTSRTRWNELSLDAAIGSRWYATGSWEEDRGDGLHTQQVLAGLSWRF